MNKPAEHPLPLSDARRLTQRVRFERDGTVSIATGKVELGQGILTALAQIAAEELGIELQKVRILPSSTAYSPDEGVTSGSLSIQDGGKALRKACAELRNAPEKPASSYEIVGKSAPRLDLPGKIAGRASYVHDMAMPGMLFGRVVRPARPFSRLVSTIELENVRIVKDGSFLGVLAEREETAIAAAAKLRAKSTWELRPDAPQDFHAWLKQHVAESNIAKEKADAAAKERGVKRVQASYTKPFIAHASIGPSCAVARMQGDRLEVWSHTQGIFGLRQDLGKVLGMPEEKIVVTHVEGAGCYGHNGADDAALDAALLARAAGGRPVKLQWSREDEFAWEPYGAAMCMALEARLDAAGAIVSWKHELWSNGHTHRPGRAQLPTLTAAAELARPFELSPAVNPALPAGGADRNAIPIYDVPDLLVVNHYVKEMPVRSSSLRSLGGYANVFAIESFMDECAAAAGVDPVVFRLKHLKDPRARAVIENLSPRWNSWKHAEGRGHGIGFAKYKNLGAYCAVLAEVEAGHELRVTRLVAAVDAGLPVNPDGLANQVEGGCIQAASWTLKEEVRPGTTNWEHYPILRFGDVPPVEVFLLRNQYPSVGAGECSMGPTAAAIANALHDALGVRVRDLPLTPERIVEAINA
ncbi:MAG TPA: molybdopterin cofactor-binding domain-containing protein [Burkholderiales bacterium]|nr:molybdopterin cofactor-binding domain-containing protein [Burkholderiales bacterium]